MEALLSDKKWRLRQSLCALWSLVPVANFFGLAIMGKRSGRKEFTAAAWGFGLVIVLSFLLYAYTDAFWSLYSSSNLAYTLNGISEVALYFLIGIGLICPVYTFAVLGRYIKYLALEESYRPARNPLTGNRRWRFANSTWMFWLLTPWTAPLAVAFQGSRMQKAGARNFGYGFFTGLMLISAIVALFPTSGNRVLLYFDDLMLYIYFLLWICCIGWCFLQREAYLDRRALVWEGDTHRFPLLAQPRWRRSNSGWIISTLLPIFGSLALALTGLKNKFRRFTTVGVTVTLMQALRMLVMAVLEGQIEGALRYRIREGSDILVAAMWVFTVFYATVHYWDALVCRATALQGYASEFDRDADMAARFRKRTPVVPKATPAPAAPVKTAVEQPAVPESGRRLEFAAAPKPEPKPEPQPEPRPVPKPEPVRPVTPAPQPVGEIVNLNTCTQEQLMQLPGVTVIGAKKAMEHRLTAGAFRSVDEFVELLELKPHFAVQVFRMARVEVQAPQPAAPRKEVTAGRRRLDF